jgi:iron complex outermembrane receptor protein
MAIQPRIKINMFKYNKITAFWAAGVAASLFGGPALAAEETIVVTAGSGEDPTAPLKGIVATKTLSATKTAAEIVKRRSRYRWSPAIKCGRWTSPRFQALRYSAGVFTEYAVHLTATTRYSYAASATCPNSSMA